MATIKRLFKQDNSIYADDILLGRYTGEKRLNGALNLCRSALCKSEAKSGNSIYKEDDFYYEMPSDNEALDKCLADLEYIQRNKETGEKLRRYIHK